MKEIELAKNRRTSVEAMGSVRELKVVNGAYMLEEVYVLTNPSCATPECWGSFGESRSAFKEPVTHRLSYHQQVGDHYQATSK